MIARRDYFRSVSENDDNILVTIRVDEKLLSVMRGAVILEMRETANYLSADMDPDEYTDVINYMKDLTRSLDALDESLNDIIEYSQAQKESNE